MRTIDRPTASRKGCYTVKEVCEALQISPHSFFYLRQRGQLPMLEELRPRLGRIIRYRADLIDRYLALGLWKRPTHRKRA